MKKEIKVVIDEHAEIAQKRKFSSGNEGYGFYGKIEIDSERYQVSLNVVRLVPKKKEV